MPHLTTDQVTKWRLSPHSFTGYFYVDNPPSVLAGTVNSTPNYPASSFSYTSTSGSYTNVEIGMAVIFGTTPGNNDLGIAYIHGSPGSSLLTITRSSKNIHQGEINITIGSYFTVLDYFPVYAFIPYIDNNGITYKNSNWDFATYGLQMQPIANIGSGLGYAQFIDPISHVVTVYLDSSTSYATQPSASISTRLWDIKDGTIISGSTSSTAIVATFPAGRRWVSLTVTDSNGKFSVRHFFILAANKTGNYSPLNTAIVTSRKITKTGQELSAEIREPLPILTYPDESLVIYWENEYNGSESGGLIGPTGMEHVKFCGYFTKVDDNSKSSPKGTTTNITLHCVDVLGKLITLPGMDDIVQRSTNPTTWQMLYQADINQYIVRLWLYNSSAHNLSDFTAWSNGSNYPFPTLASQGDNLFNQIESKAKAVTCEFTCDPWNRIKVLGNPQEQITSDQHATGAYPNVQTRTSTVIIDLNETDFQDIQYNTNILPNVYWLRGSACIVQASDATDVASIGTVFCTAPGPTPGQGSQQRDDGSMLVINQAELNAIIGHRYHASNFNRKNFKIKLTHTNYPEIFSPSFMEWITITTTANYTDPRGYIFSGTRFLVTEVNISQNNQNGSKNVELTIEEEVIGVEANTTIPPTASDAGLDTSITDGLGVPENPLLDEGIGSFLLYAGRPNIGAINSDGYIYQTSNFTTPSTSGGPTWNPVSLGVSGTVVGGLGDPFSPKYLNGTGNVNGWIVTTTGIYYVTALNGTPSASLQKSFRSSVSARTIQMSFGNEYNILVSSSYSDGVYETRSTDGSTWSTETLIGNASLLGTQYPGASVSSHTFPLYLTSADNSGSGAGYKATSGSFSVSSSPVLNSGSDLAGDIHTPYNNNSNDLITYYGKIETSGSWTVTYDLTAHNPSYYGLTMSYISQGGATPSWVSGKGYGGLGVYSVSLDKTLSVSYPMYIDTLHSEMLAIVPDSSGTFSLVGGYPPASTSYPSPSSSYFTYTYDRTYSPTVEASNPADKAYYTPLSGVYSGNNYPGNNYETYMSKVIITGHGNVPSGGVSSTGLNLVRVESDGTTQTNISPVTNYTVWKSRQIDSDSSNRLNMIIVCGDNGQSLAGVYISNDGGDTWREFVTAIAPGSRYEHCAISGDGQQTTYFWGTNGVIGSATNTSDPDSRIGNISTSGEFVNIIGL